MFQSSLLEWSVHVSHLRESHSSLNFFTTDQLVLLSGQVAALVHKGDPLSVEAAMLLNLIARGMVPVLQLSVMFAKFNY